MPCNIVFLSLVSKRVYRIGKICLLLYKQGAVITAAVADLQLVVTRTDNKYIPASPDRQPTVTHGRAVTALYLVLNLTQTTNTNNKQYV